MFTSGMGPRSQESMDTEWKASVGGEDTEKWKNKIHQFHSSN